MRMNAPTVFQADDAGVPNYIDHGMQPTALWDAKRLLGTAPILRW